MRASTLESYEAMDVEHKDDASRKDDASHKDTVESDDESELWDAPARARTCRRFCQMYKDAREPRMKPKFHMFQELAEYSTPLLGNPRSFWNYAD